MSMHDFGLAAVHHVLVFGLTAMLAMELAILRGARIDVRRLARLDGGYGLTAVLVVIVGFVRAIWGAKGWAYYSDNPAFWTKVGLFVAMGLISILPTVAFIKWSKAAKADGAFQPTPREVAGAAMWVRIEILLLLLLVVAAAAMARWPLA
jgi:putative membrane protein